MEQRNLVSVEELDRSKGFWAIEGSAYKSSEEFIRRMPTGISLARLASLGGYTMSLPDGDIVSGYADNPGVANLLDEIFEVDAVDIQRVHNQAGLHWRPLSSTAPMWRSVLPRGPQRQRTIQALRSFRGIIAGWQNATGLLLQHSTDLRVVGISGECGLKAAARVYLFCGNEMHQYITDRLVAVEEGAASPESYGFEVAVLCAFALDQLGVANLPRALDQLRDQVGTDTRFEISEELVAILQNRHYRLFDSTRGERSGSPFANWLSPWD